MPVQRMTNPLPTTIKWQAFYRQTDRPTSRNNTVALIVILKLVISVLTIVILVTLSTIYLQFQGQFVPISLRSVFEIVAEYVMV